MSATIRLLDKFKETRSLPSDNAAAIALGIHRATVSGWRQRGTQAEPHVIAHMAKAVAEDAGGWLALVESERARTDADRKAWAAVAKQLGAAAVLAIVALLPGFAKASTGSNLNGFTPYALCEMNRRRKLARALHLFRTFVTERLHGTPALLA